MSVLDDVLGFFRDLIRGNTEDSDNRRTLRDEDVPAVKQAILGAIQGGAFASGRVLGTGVAEALAELGQAVSDAPLSVSGLERSISGWVSDRLDPILALTNIDRSESSGFGGQATVERELSIFEVDSDRAINGATLASATVVAINVAAFALDQGEQFLSLGQIEGWQQLLQNIIWATGLADLGGLTFRPQIASSFGPLLQRHWAARSQAEIPGTGDLVRFQVREVFDPFRREQLGASDTPDAFRRFMEQRGFSQYWADSYWAAHWLLPSTTQLNEMTHRGVLNAEEWAEQVKLNDFVPEGIPWLREIIFSPFTRVDVRRMGDLGVLTDTQLLSAYADLGYFAPRADDGHGRALFAAEVNQTFDATVHKAEALVVFTRVYNALPSIRRRLSNGFLRPDQVRQELLSTGVPDATATKLTQELVDAVDLGQSEAVRELTTSQILRGYKQALISFAQGLYLLQELGWSSSRAEFLLRLTLSLDEAQLQSTELGRRLTNGNV